MKYIRNNKVNYKQCKDVRQHRQQDVRQESKQKVEHNAQIAMQVRVEQDMLVLIKGATPHEVHALGQNTHSDCTHLLDDEPQGASHAGQAVAVGPSLVDTHSPNLHTPLGECSRSPLQATVWAFLPPAVALPSAVVLPSAAAHPESAYAADRHLQSVYNDCWFAVAVLPA